MSSRTQIRILEDDSNRRGDLFGRLMSDLFIALGYLPPRLNIHKSGREIDIQAEHRMESRRAIGECKATAEKSGGSDLNKFAGAFGVEDNNPGLAPLTGYFISLAGFTETAIEQETSRSWPKLILLSGPDVVVELVTGRSIIEKERATEVAGRCRAALDYLDLDPDAELLAHERGWVWAVYYTQGKARTHFALIHSDGTPLAWAVAEDLIQADELCGGTLRTLHCLNPKPAPGSDGSPKAAAALDAYRRYVVEECGFIHLDGMSADGDVGSRRLRLENLFIPLSLDLEEKNGLLKRCPVGEALTIHSRLAILAPPGGGKSTLLKRIAVAYSDPSRREMADDSLPSQDWLPLFFRCRELRSLARASFSELLDALSSREPVRLHAGEFRALADRALLAGRAILLIDGLDEINDPGDRAAFVCTLRAALQAYPGVGIVVTSREAGFRHVAAHLAQICTKSTLSLFDDQEISRLITAWHREVVGETEKIREDAESLAKTILNNDRIRRLSANPLLLTTLLLVKRWVGNLPTRRAILYEKAVEVLLMTWNTEGYAPIPYEEAVPQLCYVASAMMIDGIQKISRPRLASRLQEARDALPTELGYVQGTVEGFIRRVEERSSLMMMTGHDVEEGTLVEFFEFRHLTFQEFLAARAMVKGWHPGREESDSLTTVLMPHLTDEKWAEIFPLAAVLGGKETEQLIRHLTTLTGQRRPPSRKQPEASLGLGSDLLLLRCLADEAAAKPDTIRSAIRELVRVWDDGRFRFYARDLCLSRYGNDLRDEARKAALSGSDQSCMRALPDVVWYQSAQPETASGYLMAATTFHSMLESREQIDRCEGALGCMFLCFSLTQAKRDNPARLTDTLPLCTPVLCQIGDQLSRMADSESKIDQAAATWALAWLGDCKVWTPLSEPDLLACLLGNWIAGIGTDAGYFACWSFVAQQVQPREAPRRLTTVRPETISSFWELSETEYQEAERHKVAQLIVAWYRGHGQRVSNSLQGEDFCQELGVHHASEHLAP